MRSYHVSIHWIYSDTHSEAHSPCSSSSSPVSLPPSHTSPFSLAFHQCHSEKESITAHTVWQAVCYMFPHFFKYRFWNCHFSDVTAFDCLFYTYTIAALTVTVLLLLKGKRFDTNPFINVLKPGEYWFFFLVISKCDSCTSDNAGCPDSIVGLSAGFPKTTD